EGRGVRCCDRVPGDVGVSGPGDLTGGTVRGLLPRGESEPAPPEDFPGPTDGSPCVILSVTARHAGLRDRAGTEGRAGDPPVREPRLFYGAGGIQPVPPVSQWQAGVRGAPITWAGGSATPPPPGVSPLGEARTALGLGG